MYEYFARYIMNSDVVTIDHSSPVADADKKMAEKGIGCVIVTKQGSPVGILTERDIVRMVALKSPMSSNVLEAMSSPLVSLSPDSTVWELAEEMKLRKIHKIPIIHEDRLVGIVTTSDITRLCSIGSDSEMRMVCQQILQRLNQP